VVENERAKLSHNYGVSFWFYFNPQHMGMSSSAVDTAVVNFSNRPLIEYNANKNQLLITMHSGRDGDAENKTTLTLNNIKLQKWNNLVINYTSGTLDVFLDGILVVSKPGIAPYLEEKPITVGTFGGINGRICNVSYYKKPINTVLINNMFFANKDKPVPTGGGVISNALFITERLREISIPKSMWKTTAYGLAQILPSTDMLGDIYAYFENLPENLEVSWTSFIDGIFDYQIAPADYDEKEEKKPSNAFEIDLARRKI